MRVPPLALARQMVHAIAVNTDALNRTTERIGTGRRLLRPSEDPTSVAQALRWQNALALSQGDGRRLEQTLAFPEAMDTLLLQGVEVLQRARELLLMAQNGTLSSEQQATLAEEMEGLRQELLRIANTRLGGRSLFAGTQVFTQPFDEGGAYQGSDEVAQWEASPFVALPLALSGRWVFQGEEDLFGVMEEAQQALRIGDASALPSLLSRLDRGMAHLLKVEARLGAQIRQGERLREGLTQEATTLQGRLSVLVDADLAEEAIAWRLKEVALQATLLATVRLLPHTLVEVMA